MKSLNKPVIQFVVRSNNSIIMFRNGKFIPWHRSHSSIFNSSPEQVRGTADVFYLRPTGEAHTENIIWYSKESLSPTIIDQILNRLKLLPDFYTQTKPVETGSTPSNGNNSMTTSTAPPPPTTS